MYNWAPTSFFSCLFLLAAVTLWSSWYFQNHQIVVVDGIEIQVYGRVYYSEKGSEFGSHQFFASNEICNTGMTMNPFFTITNSTASAREVNIRSLSAWETPIHGDIHLEPGQQFEFRLQADKRGNYWYCWIKPQPLKEKNKNS